MEIAKSMPRKRRVYTYKQITGALCGATIPIASLFLQYMRGLVSIGNTICWIVVLLCFILYRKLSIPRTFLALSVFYCGRLLLNYFFSDISMTAYLFYYLRLLSCPLATILLAAYADEDVMYKVWRIMGIFVITILIFQYVQVYAMGRMIRPMNLLPISSDEAEASWLMYSSRLCSVFTEPSVFACYLMPLLFMANKRGKFGMSIVVTLAVLLSTSTNGIVICVVLWGYELIKGKMRNSRKLLIAVTVILFAVAFLTLPMFQATRDKIFAPDVYAQKTIDYRLRYGAMIYQQMPTVEKIFGIFSLDLEHYMLSGNVYIQGFSRSLYGYTNDFMKIPIYSGVIGFGFYIYMFVRYIRYGEMCHSVAYTVALLAMSFSSKTVFEPLMLISYAPFLVFNRWDAYSICKKIPKANIQ